MSKRQLDQNGANFRFWKVLRVPTDREFHADLENNLRFAPKLLKSWFWMGRSCRQDRKKMLNFLYIVEYTVPTPH